MRIPGTGVPNTGPDIGSMETDPPPPLRGASGSVIANKYRLLEKIGEGGMGAVYEAEHVHTHRRVALKMLLDEERSRPTDSARFMREARAASQIGHPGIVEVLDAGYHRGQPYVALELLHGETLEDALDAGTLTLGALREISMQVLDALHAAHEAGIIHRDIKPENIFLLEGDAPRAKLLDFGIAKTIEGVDTKLTVTGTVMGTPSYMSPEQAKGEVVDRRADLWSVAAMLFRAVVGVPPYDADNYNVLIARLLTQEPPEIADAHPTLPAPFANAIRGGLQRKIDMRLESAAAMLAVLKDAEGSEDWAGLPSTARDLPARPRQHLSGDRTMAADAASAETQPEIPPEEELLPAAPAARSIELAASGPSPLLWVAVAVAVLGLGGGALVWSMQTPGAAPTPAPDVSAPPPPSPVIGGGPIADVAEPPEAEPEVIPEAEPEPPAGVDPPATEPTVVADAVEPAASETTSPPSRRRIARRRRPSNAEPVAAEASGRRRGVAIEREYE